MNEGLCFNASRPKRENAKEVLGLSLLDKGGEVVVHRAKVVVHRAKVV